MSSVRSGLEKETKTDEIKEVAIVGSIGKSGKIMAVLAAAVIICCACGKEEASQTASEDVRQTGTEAAPQTAEETESEVSKEEASGEPSKEVSESGKAAMSVAEVYEKIGEEVTLQSPACMDDDFISNYYGLDTALLEEYVFSISEDAAQAETVIIAKVKDAGDAEQVAESLQAVVEDKKAEMENYIPEQFAIVEKSEVVIKDNYVWLVISENEDSITSVIENNLF